MDVPGYALITGAGSGIARATSIKFSDEGCAGLALLDLNLQGLEETKAIIEKRRIERGQDKSFPILLYQLDIVDENKIDATVDAVAKEFGRIDYLVNAAGLAMKHPGGAAFVDSKDWKRMIDINLNGCFFIFRAVSKIMLKQDPIISVIDGRPIQRGSIVFIASIQSVAGISLSTGYATAKTAVLGLMRTASEDYAKDGLRINSVCPGYTETPLTTGDPKIAAVMKEKVANAVPMCRMGKPEEIADGVLYLAGGRGSFVTGTALMVDGGYTQR